MVLVRGATFALITSCVLLGSCSSTRQFGPTVGEVFSGMGSAQAAANAQTGIGVNAFLWRATLDTLSFMPLANADLSWVSHCVPGTPGFELLDELPQPLDYDYFVWKGVEPDLHPYGACYHDLAEKRSTCGSTSELDKPCATWKMPPTG